jgi:solute carrier family 12 sodium/potassium/chloride transporter 2
MLSLQKFLMTGRRFKKYNSFWKIKSRLSMHLDVGKLEEKAHLRDSIRMTRSLQDHLNRETLPSPDNYHTHFLTIGSRATLDELHLGEVYDPKVCK